MGAFDKLDVLGTAAQFDVCGACGQQTSARANVFPYQFIHKADAPGGRQVNLFKVLLTNVCTNDCAYCVNQVGRDVPRSAFQPDELARLFMNMASRRLVQGLFLSSGIGTNPTQTMERMIDTTAILRHRYRFDGYIHLKLLPGAAPSCIEEACRLASRVSVNIEAPTPEHLSRLSARKDLYKGILGPMQLVRRLVSSHRVSLPAGQSTQFVVGAAGESDRDILEATHSLYKEVGLARAYFSAFRPVPESRLENVGATPPMREHRLYQSDWLLRVYKFTLQEVELALKKDGDLPLSKDPKLLIAEKQPWLFPVDVNTADYHELLRVPGIGPISAKRILQVRRQHRLSSLNELRRLGAATRAASFVWLKDMELSSCPFPVQSPLFTLPPQLAATQAI